MHIFEAVVSGVIQGITEFLPISSSGHLVVLHTMFGYSEAKVLEDVLLHFGTLFAVVIFFWKDIVALFREKRLFLLIIIGSIPIALTGFFFGKDIEPLFANTKVVGASLLVTGLWLLAAHLFSRNTQYPPSPRLRRTSAVRNTRLSIGHALLIGVSQAIALLPGMSRSGATISTGLLLRRGRSEVFRFSFLLSVPAVLGALFYKMGDFIRADLAGLGIMMWGSITACFVGIIALWFLKKVLLKQKLYYFTIYCWAAGLILLFV